MKYSFAIKILVILGIFLTTSSYSQENKVTLELQKLISEMSENSDSKEINETLNKAEKLFQDKTLNSENNLGNLAQNTLWFGELRKKISEIIKAKFEKSYSGKDKSITRNELLKLSDLDKKNLSEIEKLFEDANNLFEKNPNFEDIKVAKIKIELALSLKNFEPLTIDPQSPKGKRVLTWEEITKRIDKSQKLYSQALEILKKVLPQNDDEIILNTLALANFFTQTADFEKSLPLYEEYIIAVQQKYGNKAEYLIPILEIKATILRMIGDNEFSKTSDEIAKISGNKTDLTNSALSVSGRTKSLQYKGITGKNGFEAIYSTNSFFPEGTRSKVSGSDNFFNIKIVKYEITKVFVVINENGEVVEANPQTDNKKLKEEVKEDVLRWKFNPLEYKGKIRRIEGFVYHYKEKEV